MKAQPISLTSSPARRSPPGRRAAAGLSRWACAALLGSLALASLPRGAQAQFERVAEESESVASPQHFALELRVGPYQPNVGTNEDTGQDPFNLIFNEDEGPLLATELDFLFFRLDGLLSLGVGLGVGWTHYDADACVLEDCTGNDPAGEETSLTLVPLTAVGVARVDALARKLGIPFVFTGKLGFDYVYWSTDKGALPATSGWSLGLRWALQVALELDFFEPRTARALDEEWGINHSFVFFEYLSSDAEGDSLPVGDKTWAAGLGFIF